MKLRVLICLGIIIFIITAIVGCKSKNSEDEDKIADLDYTIVDDEDLPEIVLTKIDEEKSESFKFSYSNGEYMYIIIGYGEQPTGGYSIQVDKLYLTKEYIIVSTTLLGPSNDEAVITTPTHPYITIKTEDLKLPVCFK